VIVLDASAVVELLLDTAVGRRIAIRIKDPALAIHVPHLVDVEVTSALRRIVREGSIDSDEAEAALDDLRALDLQRHSHEPLLDRAWALRNNVSVYDGICIALAEALDATLVTCDARLHRVKGVNARIALMS
jgi:predicted nucleic acid-binding protein